MNLLDIEKEISNNSKEIIQTKKSIEEKLKYLEKRNRALENKKQQYLIDPTQGEVIQKALDILLIEVTYGYRRLFTQAKADIISGKNYMSKGYFGMKSYAHFIGQESDHEYYYGPKHGYVTDRVGIREKYRKGLSEEDKNTILVFLERMIADEEFRRKIYKHIYPKWDPKKEERR